MPKVMISKEGKMKGKYPERTKYFAFKKSDRVRYFKFKTKCPNCGKVCVEDFLADKGERIKRAPLINYHRFELFILLP